MTKIEELKAACDAARADYKAAYEAAAAAAVAYDFAFVVYRAELNNIQPSRAKEDTRGEL
jgi:hypothetical protein